MLTTLQNVVLCGQDIPMLPAGCTSQISDGSLLTCLILRVQLFAGSECAYHYPLVPHRTRSLRPRVSFPNSCLFLIYQWLYWCYIGWQWVFKIHYLWALTHHFLQSPRTVSWLLVVFYVSVIQNVKPSKADLILHKLYIWNGKHRASYRVLIRHFWLKTSSYIHLYSCGVFALEANVSVALFFVFPLESWVYYELYYIIIVFKAQC